MGVHGLESASKLARHQLMRFTRQAANWCADVRRLAPSRGEALALQPAAVGQTAVDHQLVSTGGADALLSAHPPRDPSLP
jgi:hypothetical protein